MEALQLEHYYTYADYEKWETERPCELINGIPHAMASPSQAHQRVSRQLIIHLGLFLDGKTCELFHAPFDVRLNADEKDDIVVIPDLLVVCDPAKLDGKSCTGAPDMVIEIISPSTERHDMFTKFFLYKKAGVREYWIVDPINKGVQTHVLHVLEEGKYLTSLYGETDMLPVHVLEGCQIDLKKIFI